MKLDENYEGSLDYICISYLQTFWIIAEIPSQQSAEMRLSRMLSRLTEDTEIFGYGHLGSEPWGAS